MADIVLEPFFIDGVERMKSVTMEGETQNGGAAAPATLKFRNYVPQDPELRQWCLPRPFVEELEKQIDNEGREAIEAAMNEDVASQITPRRPNWDLKREIEKKLTILARRTDRAIVELVRRRVAESGAAGGLRDPHHGDRDPGSCDSLSQKEKEVVHAVVAAAKDLQKIEDDDEDL